MTAKQLKAIRKRLNLTQSELAKATGYTRTTISKWETGAHIICDRAATAIGSASQLLHGKGLAGNVRSLLGEPYPHRSGFDTSQIFGKSPFG